MLIKQETQFYITGTLQNTIILTIHKTQRDMNNEQ